MPLLLVGSCCLLGSDFLLKILLLHLKGHFFLSNIFFPSDLSLRLSPVITLLHLLQAFTTLCWVHSAVCVEASSRGTNRKGVPHAADVLCGLCPYLLCCRGSAVQLRQLSEQRRCGLEHSSYQFHHHCLSSCHTSTNRPFNRFCCSC